METIHGFSPVSCPDARILILGSMPSIKSLDIQEYYAHPRNAFWKIMAALFRFDPDAPYPQRKSALKESGVALWDVMAACTRRSSLDSDIIESSVVANDFRSFYGQHRQISQIYFNGLKAESSYRKFVGPGLPTDHAIPGLRLPSSSPANARMTFAEKLETWKRLILTIETIS